MTVGTHPVTAGYSHPHMAALHEDTVLLARQTVLRFDYALLVWQV